jgi:phage gpG-like protein
MTTTVTLNDAEFLALLDRLKSNVTNLRPAMADIGANMVSLIHQNLGQGVTPWGEPMKPLKYRQGVPLNDTRMHIYQRITYAADTNSVRVGMLDSEAAKIGQVHQYGAVIKPVKAKMLRFTPRGFKKPFFAKQVTIPARPFMPIRNEVADLPTDWMAEVLETMRKHLTDK